MHLFEQIIDVVQIDGKADKNNYEAKRIHNDFLFVK